MSKANQAFNNNDEAVSPVIGVILMVAITVVLAAVVFVLVSNLGEGSESAPNISFNKDSSDKTITVVTAEDARWEDFELGVEGAAVPATCDAELTTDDSTGVTVLPDESVDAGDFIELVDGTADTTDDCDGATLSITHLGTNSLVYETTF